LPVVPVAVETPAATGSGLRINKPVAPPAPPIIAASAPLRAGSPPVAPGRSGVSPVKPAKAAGEFNLGLGILGAVIGAGLSSGLMFGLSVAVGFKFPLMGTCIGALTGLGA